MSEITVRLIVNPSEKEIRACVQMLTESFSDDDPTAVIYTGGEPATRAHFQFEAFIRAAAIAGEIYGAFSTTGGVPFGSNSVTLVGLAVWYVPGTDAMATPEEQRVSQFWWDSMPDHLRTWWIDYFLPRSKEFTDRTVGPTLKTESYYLDVLGVHPSFRRKGVSRILLTPVFKRAKKESKCLAARTGAAYNLPVYNSLGFKLRGQEYFESSWHNMTMYLLVRDVDYEDGQKV